MKKLLMFFVIMELLISCSIDKVNAAEGDIRPATLDVIKASEIEYLNGEHYLYSDLSTTEDTSKQSVLLPNTNDNKYTKYWFLPQDGDTNIINLSNTGTKAVGINKTNAVFKVGDTYYAYDTDKLPQSKYKWMETTSGNQTFSIQTGDTTKYYKFQFKSTADKIYNFTTPENDDYLTFTIKAETGGLNQKYSIGLNTDKMSTSGAVTWGTNFTDKLDSATFTLPNKEETTILDYKLAAQTDYVATQTHINYISSPSAVNKKLFYGISSNAGGAIYHYYSYSATSNAIIADFINNKAKDGGAIFNDNGKIGNITGDFINNSATYGGGGAICNYSGKIGNITGDFINNEATYGGGGAIDNSGTIGNITGDFINNEAEYGGAITNYNGSTIGNITGDFINNKALEYYGAIGNGGTIGNITGDFINNKSLEYYGAIGNSGTIGNITGDFINNEASYIGGAIGNENSGTIGNITGDFINNSTTDGYGGAIDNSGIIGNITGDFINNKALENYNVDVAIANNDAFSDITDNIYISYSGGGAIANNSTIGNITGDFINNYTSATTYEYMPVSYYVPGGAIYNKDTIANITGDFINNSAFFNIYSDDAWDNYVRGGAIYNTDTIANITGDFINNSAFFNIYGDDAGYNYAQGGAIYNTGTIANITGDFINNSVNSVFKGNSEESYIVTAEGGAIWNSGTINLYNTNFINNRTYTSINDVITETYNDIHNTTNDETTTGIINFSGINSMAGGITGDGTTNINGGSLTLAKSATLEQKNVNIKSGYLYTAIKNVNDNITNLNIASGAALKLALDWGDTLNDVTSGQTRAIETDGSILLSEIDFNNYTGNNSYEFAKDTSLREYIAIANDIKLVNPISGKALEYTNTDGKLTLSEVDSLQEAINKSESGKTVVYVLTKDEGGITTNNGLTGSLYVTSDNKTIDKLTVTVGTADSTNNTMAIIDTDINIGTASTENTDITIKPDNQVAITAKENDVNIKTVSDNLIALNYDTANNKNSTLIINSNGGKVNVEGDIVSDNVANQVYYQGNKDINFKGLHDPSTSDVDLANNAVLTRDGYDDEITYNLNSGTLKYTNEKYLYDSSLHGSTYGLNSMNFNGGNLDLRNSVASSIVLNSINLSANSNIFVDADLAKGTIDSVNSSTVSGSGILNVAGINLLSDANGPITTIPFADENLKGQVEYTGEQGISYSPLYKYNVNYSKDSGIFTFNKFGYGGNYDNYNPSLFATPVGAQIGGYLTQLNSYDEAFRNMDMYMLMSKEQRQAMKFANKYASNKTDVIYDPTYEQYYNNAAWFRPYVTFENVPLKNGPKVNNTAYGAYFGGDSGLKELGHGWDGLWGVYVGYNGSTQSYDGNKIYQNGGTLGLNGTLYKGNFFLGGTINVGASGAEQNTMYGKDNFALLMGGVAAKAGYNWELFNGRFIIQPSYMMSYSFVNAFDYTNAAGVRMSSDPLHAIQIAPEIKFIGNLKNGWQPYASVQMVWNLIDETHFNASYAGTNVNLPSLSVDPFVKYGVGVQKSWGQKFTGFFQTYVTNGGRNGVGLQAGFRWALGKTQH